MTLQWYSVGLFAIGYFTFVPLTIANGTSAGHMSAMGRHENGQRNEHCRSPRPFLGSIISLSRRHLRLGLFVHADYGTAG